MHFQLSAEASAQASAEAQWKALYSGGLLTVPDTVYDKAGAPPHDPGTSRHATKWVLATRFMTNAEMTRHAKMTPAADAKAREALCGEDTGAWVGFPLTAAGSVASNEMMNQIAD